LIHLISLHDHRTFQICRIDGCQRVGLQLVPQFQQARSIDVEFARHLCSALALRYATLDHDQLRWTSSRALENRACKNVKNPAARAAAIIHYDLPAALVNLQTLTQTATRTR
jgi:hypothetical protein